MESTVESLTNSIGKKLLNESKNPDDFNAKLIEMKQELISEYSKSLEAAFESNKDEISKYMSIPKNVVLKEDLSVKIGMEADPIQTEKQIEELKNRYMAQLFFKQKILDEIEEADSTIFIMEKYVDDEDVKSFKFDQLPTDEGMALSQENLSLI